MVGFGLVWVGFRVGLISANVEGSAHGREPCHFLAQQVAQPNCAAMSLFQRQLVENGLDASGHLPQSRRSSWKDITRVSGPAFRVSAKPLCGINGLGLDAPAPIRCGKPVKVLGPDCLLRQ